MFLFCLVFAMFCARLFICASWSPAGKGLTSWLSFVVSSVSLSLSHWYPGSGVVLDCIDSWSLQPYLLLPLPKFIHPYGDRCLKYVWKSKCKVILFAGGKYILHKDAIFAKSQQAKAFEKKRSYFWVTKKKLNHFLILFYLNKFTILTTLSSCSIVRWPLNMHLLIKNQVLASRKIWLAVLSLLFWHTWEILDWMDMILFVI